MRDDFKGPLSPDATEDYEGYESWKKSRGKTDFEDMIKKNKKMSPEAKKKAIDTYNSRNEDAPIKKKKKNSGWIGLM